MPVVIEDREARREPRSLNHGCVGERERQVIGRHAGHFELQALDLAGRVGDLADRAQASCAEVRHPRVDDVLVRRVQRDIEARELHEHELHDAQLPRAQHGDSGRS
ncbi:hypothetical protein D3C87_1680440 [compost metagenome]